MTICRIAAAATGHSTVVGCARAIDPRMQVREWVTVNGRAVGSLAVGRVAIGATYLNGFKYMTN